MTSENYRQLLNAERDSLEMTKEDFDNTLMHFAMLYHKEQLKLCDVVSSKRFTCTDMLNAYIRGFKDADVDESGLGYVKTDVITENGLKWLKEYHK